MLFLIGVGDFREKLQAQVERLNLTNTCTFGNHQDVPKLLAASDLFVLPPL